MIKNPKPMHPGIVLNEIYMKEKKLNQSQLAEKSTRLLMGNAQFHLNLQ